MHGTLMFPSLHNQRVEEPNLLLVFHQRGVTVGLRLLWKVLADVVSKSCEEVFAVAEALEKKSAPFSWVEFPFVFQHGCPRCAVASFFE